MSSKAKRSRILCVLKLHGFSLNSDATNYLTSSLNSVNEVEFEDWLDRIVEAIQKQSLTSSLLDKGIIETAIQECTNQETESSKVFSVINAFDIPIFVYNMERKKFLKAESQNLSSVSLHANAKSKADFFQERYKILFQRTCRHDLFTPLTIGSYHDNARKFQLRKIEYLLGSSTKLPEVIVLGMLSQLKEGKYYLEDLTGAVQLDLTKASFHVGLFTENCFVLAEGSYEDELFHINALGFPPPEPSSITRAYFGNINFFGGPSPVSIKSSTKLLSLEKRDQNAMFVFLSDVWLDQIKVLEKLQILFNGLAEAPPICFVFCGNFLSSPNGNKQNKLFKECLKKLATIIKDFPLLIENSKFIFVPGSQDPGPGVIFPRPCIPSSLTEDFLKIVSSAIFTSNPCRIQYCTQEIIVFKEDIVSKMCRNSIYFPTDDKPIHYHFVKTIISQGHLCPLPLHVIPIYWSYDHALRIYPLPDLLVCADKYDSYTVNSVDCNVINPGSFARNGFCFKVYFPSVKEIEDSKIDVISP